MESAARARSRRDDNDREVNGGKTKKFMKENLDTPRTPYVVSGTRMYTRVSASSYTYASCLGTNTRDCARETDVYEFEDIRARVYRDRRRRTRTIIIRTSEIAAAEHSRGRFYRTNI